MLQAAALPSSHSPWLCEVLKLLTTHSRIHWVQRTPHCRGKLYSGLTRKFHLFPFCLCFVFPLCRHSNWIMQDQLRRLTYRYFPYWWWVCSKLLRLPTVLNRPIICGSKVSLWSLKWIYLIVMWKWDFRGHWNYITLHLYLLYETNTHFT